MSYKFNPFTADFDEVNTDASNISITDSNDYYNAENVEDAFEELGETKNWNGYDRENSDSMPDLSWDNGTRTFSCSVKGGQSSFHFWVKGKKVIKTTTQTVIIPDISDSYYTYFDNDGVLQYISGSSVPDAAFYEYAITGLVRWNATQGLGGAGDERHGIRMSATTHKYNHDTLGARYASGIDIEGLADNSPNYTQTNSGCFWDEDIEHCPTVQTTHGWLYRLGANGEWTTQIADNEVGLLESGDTYYSWNEWTGSTWQLTEGGVLSDYFITFFVANPSLNGNQVVKILGHNAYANVTTARNAIEDEVHTLQLEGLPGPEIVFLYAVIVKRNGDLQELSDGSLIYDLRTLKGGAAGGSASSNVAADITTDTTNFDNLLSSTDTNVQTALDTLDDHYHSKLVASDGDPDPALSVDADGYVGIGTDTPLKKIHISGDSNDGASLRLERTDGAGVNWDLLSNSDSDLYIKSNDVSKLRLRSVGSFHTFRYSDGIGNLAIQLDGAGEIAGFRINSDGNLIIDMHDGSSWNSNFVIQQNGNIGIGTDSPSEKLDVQGNIIQGENGTDTSFSKKGNTVGDEFFIGTNGSFRVQRASGGSECFRTQINGDSHGRLLGNSSGVISWGPGNGIQDVNLYRGQIDELKSDDKLRLDGGNIKIVTSNSGTSEFISMVNTGGFAAAAPAINWNNSVGNFDHARIRSEPGSGFANSKLYFSVADSSKVLQDRAVIDVNGYVGIGTDAPSVPLEVEGVIISNGGAFTLNRENASGANRVNVYSDDIASWCGFNFYRARGTQASPTAITSGTIIAKLNSVGYYDSINVHRAAEIITTTTEDWSVTNRGIKYDFTGTSAGSATRLTWMTILNGNVGIGVTDPDTKLDVNGAITQRELSADPADPDEGSSVTWQSDGTGSGDDGDIMMKITAGGVTKTTTLVDFSVL